MTVYIVPVKFEVDAENADAAVELVEQFLRRVITEGPQIFDAAVDESSDVSVYES